MAIKGRITEWYADKGYGYVTPDADALRIKFYQQDVANSVDLASAPGQAVRFDIVQDEQGKRRATRLDGVRDFPWAPLVAMWFFAALLGCALYWDVPRAVGYYYLAASALVCGVCALDKRAEKRKKPRTSASALLFLALSGGWPGALIGQYYFNLPHRSLLFQLLMFAVALGHVMLLIWTLTPSGRMQFQALAEILQTRW